MPVTRVCEIITGPERQGVLVTSATNELDGADSVYWDRFGADVKGRGAALSQVVLAVYGVSVLAQEAAL